MPWRADGPSGGPAGRAPGCETVREWIDPYLDELDEPDGGLEPARRTALEAHTADCPDCRAEVTLARRLRRELRRGLPLLSCPRAVSDEVLRIAAAEAREAEARPARPGLGKRLTSWLERLAAWLGAGALRPALAAAALVLLVLAVPLLYRAVIEPDAGGPGSVTERPGAGTDGAVADADFTEAEIAEAEEQARQVLAYVASVGRDAGRAVQEDVFDPGIVRPTRRAVAGIGGDPGEPARRNRP